MTYNKLPGVYFTETVSTISTQTAKVPLFIVEGSTAIADVDNQLVTFANFDAFRATFSADAFSTTVDIVEEALAESGLTNNKFYVYKNTTGTGASFTNILVDSSNNEEIEDVIYIEGIKGTGANTFNAKLGGLKAGANTCYENGVNRVIYAVPVATVAADVAAKGENVTDEAAAITSLETAVNGINSGRISVIVPDYAGAVIGRVLAAAYNQEIGYTPISTAISAPSFNFTYSQMVNLQNMGVMFVRGERLRGSVVYRVNLGVSTSFSSDAADGLLLSRRVADEVLREVKTVCDSFVKAPNDIDDGLQGLQADIDDVVDRFITAREVFEDETQLTVEEGNTAYDFIVSGTIKPIKSTIAINVNTKLA